MLGIFLILISTLACPLAHAQNALPLQPIEESLILARDPDLDPNLRMQAGQRALETIQREIMKEAGIDPDSEGALTQLQNRLLGSKLESDATQKDPQLGRIITEFSSLLETLSIEAFLGECIHNKDCPIYRQVISGINRHSYCNEGLWNSSCFLFQQGNLPFYARDSYFSSTLERVKNSWLKSETPRLDGSDFLHPRQDQLVAASIPGIPRPELSADEITAKAKKILFRGKIYERALISAIRNRVTLEHQFLNLNPAENLLESLVDTAISDTCRPCSEGMRQEIRDRVLALIQNDQRTGKMGRDPGKVGAAVEGLCSSLKDLGYEFREFKDTELGKRLERAVDEEIAVLSRTSPNGGPIAIQSISARDQALVTFNQNRKNILLQFVFQGGAGLLMMTDAMAKQEDGMPSATHLQCSATSSTSDQQILTTAAQKAIVKTNEYATKLQTALRPHEYLDDGLIQQSIEELTELAPTAAGEALVLLGTKQNQTDLCTALKNLNLRNEKQKAWDDVVFWGQAVAGTALVIATGGEAAPLVAGGLWTTNIAMNAYGTHYFWLRADEAREKADLFQEAAIGANNMKLLEITRGQLQEFKNLRLNAVLSGVATLADVGLAIRQVSTAQGGFDALLQNLRTKRNYVATKTNQYVGIWNGPTGQIRLAIDDAAHFMSAAHQQKIAVIFAQNLSDQEKMIQSLEVALQARVSSFPVNEQEIILDIFKQKYAEIGPIALRTPSSRPLPEVLELCLRAAAEVEEKVLLNATTKVTVRRLFQEFISQPGNFSAQIERGSLTMQYSYLRTIPEEGRTQIIAEIEALSRAGQIGSREAELLISPLKNASLPSSEAFVKAEQSIRTLSIGDFPIGSASFQSHIRTFWNKPGAIPAFMGKFLLWSVVCDNVFTPYFHGPGSENLKKSEDWNTVCKLMSVPFLIRF